MSGPAGHPDPSDWDWEHANFQSQITRLVLKTAFTSKIASNVWRTTVQGASDSTGRTKFLVQSAFWAP